MDCNRCNTNYNRGNYNMRGGMQNNGYNTQYNNMRKPSYDKPGYADKMKAMEHDGDCNKKTGKVDYMEIGMCYVPWQKWEDIYDIDKALERGTIFAQLDKPFLGRAAR